MARAVSDTVATAIAVISLAEREQLMVVAPEREGGDLLADSTVYRMTARGAGLAESWGLKGTADDPDDAAESQSIATAFLLMYAKHVGLPLVSDVSLHEAIDKGTLRIAAEGFHKARTEQK